MKKLSFFISLQLAASMCNYVLPMQSSAKEAPVQLNNIVLFAQYNSPQESNFMAKYSEKIDELCNAENTNHSLNGYVNTISYNQLNVTSYFPQMKDGVIIPYDLSMNESDYMNCDQYALEMISNIEVSEDIPLDGNGDGIVDNIILVVDGKADNMTSPIWPKAFTCPGIKLNGINVETVNMHNSYQLFENTITGSEGVLCHEFMHSLGYPDLYRNNRTGTPVGLWDIMASNSVFVQYPLAYQRASISGWLDYSTITENGTYTLTPASESSGDRLYILKTPLSDTEFFAVEYRKQGTRYSDEMDVKIYGSGLCVYRVNTDADGNFKSEHDEIYVFRPDETNLDAGEGDILRSNYGGENAPNFVGSLDWNDGISEGALVYSNGTNSGIKLSDITMNDDSLTFKAEFADRTDVSLWESIDTSKIGAALPYDIANAPDGTIWTIAANSKNTILYKVEDNQLSAFGNPLDNENVNNPKLIFCGDIPYVMYRDRDFIVHLNKMNMDSGSWTEVYKGEELAQYADITTDGKNIYLSYTRGSFPYHLEVSSFNTEIETITDLVFLNKDNVCNLSSSFCDGKLIIGYRSINDGNISKIAVFSEDTSSWEVLTVSDNECGAVSVNADISSAWITPWGAGNSVYKYADGILTEYPLPNDVANNAFMQCSIIIGGKVYVAVNNQNPDELSLYTLENDSWTSKGDIIAREVVNEFAITAGKTDLYCSFFTLNYTPIIKKLTVNSQPIEEKIRGDVNADKKFDIIDIVMLQKWLLGVGNIIDLQAADMYEDKKINIFDILIMKEEFIENAK